MDAIYDVDEVMDDLYLQHLSSDLECHELIILPIQLAVDSILQNASNTFRFKFTFNVVQKICENTDFLIDFDRCCQSLLMQVNYLDLLVCYGSMLMGYIHVK